MDEAERPIIVKKIKKGGHGHHGGAWKVAFADFATAMMAFFLLMWLLAAASPEQQEAIAGFFDAEAEIGIGEGGGFSDSMIDLGGTGNTSKGSEGDDWEQGGSSSKAAQELAEEAQQMAELLEVLKQAIENKEELKAYKDQLKMSTTPEGLRIQIVDKEHRPMFESGKAIMRDHATKILNEIAPIIGAAGNRISITGHTDAARFVRKDGYSNWELSADRANAARRALINAGMGEKKIGRVVGLADSALYNKENPLDPINRRISIVVMNKATDEAIGKEEGAVQVDEESAETLDLDNLAPRSNPLEGISDSVIDGAKSLESDNIIIDTQQAPSPLINPISPGSGGEVIKLPLSASEINAEAARALPKPIESAPPVPVAPILLPETKPKAKGSGAIRIDLGDLSAAPATPKATPPSQIKPVEVLIAPPKAPAKALPPTAPPKKAVTPGAVPLSLPGL